MPLGSRQVVTTACLVYELAFALEVMTAVHGTPVVSRFISLLNKNKKAHACV
jgi:hypothetical protein